MLELGNFTISRYIKRRSISQWEYIKFRYVAHLCCVVIRSGQLKISSPRGYQFKVRSVVNGHQLCLVTASTGSRVAMLINRYLRHRRTQEGLCTSHHHQKTVPSSQLGG